jgi:hypothetical protein
MPSDEATKRRFTSYVSSSELCQVRTLKTPNFGAFAMQGTLMIGCLASVAQGQKPKRSSEQSKTSCVRHSSWNCPCEKTLITHARTEAAKFLGYHIVIQHANDKLDRRGQRQVNETIGLRVPKEVIEQKCALYMRRGKPAQRAEMLDDSDYSIRSRVSG